MENLTNKKLQRKRMMQYFIDAANEIIDADGIDALSIRKVAEKAGYNSATLYNYFSNLKHLTYVSCIRYLREYADDLPFYLGNAPSPLDQYFRIWECFCIHAFDKPDIYELLFFGDLEEESFDHSFKSYYDVFPEELTPKIQEYYDMIMEHDIYSREVLALNKTCRKMNTQLPEQTIAEIAEMNILIFRGMLANMRCRHSRPSIEEATKKTLVYMRQTWRAYTVRSGECDRPQ